MTVLNLINSWQDRVYQEINRAVEARRKGNEGMARVCARRAAGYIAREYYQSNNRQELTSSAYANLTALASDEKLPLKTREVISHFLITVTLEHQLPDHIDLIADVNWLARNLKNSFIQEDKMINQYTYIENLDTNIPSTLENSILSRTIYQDNQVKIILFGFADGQELSEHTASMPAIIHLLSGEAEIKLGDDLIHAKPGAWMHMQANLTHSLLAKGPVVMLLTMLKQTK